MSDPANAAERRHRMGLICEQAGIATEDELLDIIMIGTRAKYRAGLLTDALENLRVEVEAAKHVADGIIR